MGEETGTTTDSDVHPPVEPSLGRLRDVAHGVITDEEARGLFAAAGVDSPSADTVKGFRASFAQEAARLAYFVGKRSNRRGRGAAGEDVGTTVEQRGGEMKPPERPGIPVPPEPTVEEAARDAITEGDTEELLVAATAWDPAPEAVTAFRSTLVETAVRLVQAAVDRARRRGRKPSGEDVGSAAEQLFK